MDHIASKNSEKDTQNKILSINPATLEVNEKIEVSTPDQVEETVAGAHKAFEEWRETTPSKRLEILNNFKEILLKRKHEVAKIVNSETGKPKGEAIASEISPVLDAIRFVNKKGEQILEEKIPLGFVELVNRFSKIIREPKGVVGMITPWNYPFSIPGSEIISTLFTGNCIVLKPAEQTTLTGLKLEELLKKAGLPENVLQVIVGFGHPTGDALVNSNLDHMSFTGSTKVGYSIKEKCDSRGISTHLELGGSDPAIVLEDSDLDLAAEGIVWARFTNAGQTCAAIKRVYAMEKIEPDLREKIIKKVKDLRVGQRNENENFDIGPLIDENALEKIKSQVEKSVEMGAEILVGGKEIEDLSGYFYEPTVLTNVTQEMPVVSEETFGSVLPVMSVGTVDEAVEKANDTVYGLNASIWTKDEDLCVELAKKIEAGTVVLNDHGYTYGLNATPWGGVKGSGEGWSHGRWGIEEVTEPKHIHVTEGDKIPSGTRFRDPWWFPYPEKLDEVFGDSLDILYGQKIGNRVKKFFSLIRDLIEQRDEYF